MGPAQRGKYDVIVVGDLILASRTVSLMKLLDFPRKLSLLNKVIVELV